MSPYKEPDIPALPDHKVDPSAKGILEQYVDQLVEHVSGVYSIDGLTAEETEAYKDHCFKAAGHLMQASRMLKGKSCRYRRRRKVVFLLKLVGVAFCFLAGVASALLTSLATALR